MIVAVKNICFSDDEITFDENRDIERDIEREREAARQAGVRRAKNSPAQQAAKADLIPIRRQPVHIPLAGKGENGTVIDYKKLELPTFLRRAKDAPAEEKTPDGKEGCVKASGAISEFIGNMNATPNKRLGCVDFSMPDESRVAFRRFSDAITVGERAPDDRVILSMLEIGKSDFGAIEVFGPPEFVADAVRVAIENGIVLQNPEYTQALSKSANPIMRMRGK